MNLSITHLPRHLVQQIINPGLREARHQLMDNLLDEVITDSGTALLRQLKGRLQVHQIHRGRASTRVVVLALHLQMEGEIKLRRVSLIFTANLLLLPFPLTSDSSGTIKLFKQALFPPRPPPLLLPPLLDW